MYDRNIIPVIFCAKQKQQSFQIAVIISAGMEPGIAFKHLPVGNVGIDLGRLDIGVTEHFLDRSEIGPSLQEMGRIAVPQFMRGEMLMEVKGDAFVPHQLLD